VQNFQVFTGFFLLITKIEIKLPAINFLQFYVIKPWIRIRDPDPQLEKMLDPVPYPDPYPKPLLGVWGGGGGVRKNSTAPAISTNARVRKCAENN
jgi:hypothetical protein